MNLVFLNHGRWVAECEAECGGAEKLHPDGWFRVSQDGLEYGLTRDGVLSCGSCGWRSQVEWPDDETVALVNAAMSVRKPINRNWTPGEPVAVLTAENIEHGLAVA